MARIIDELMHHGVDSERVLPVVNRAPRLPQARAEIAKALAHSLSVLRGGPVAVASPLFLPVRRRLEEFHRDAVPLPHQLVDPVTSAARALLERTGAAPAEAAEPVRPGSLGAWR
jgi:hypothetical protein